MIRILLPHLLTLLLLAPTALRAEFASFGRPSDRTASIEKADYFSPALQMKSQRGSISVDRLSGELPFTDRSVTVAPCQTAEATRKATPATGGASLLYRLKSLQC